MTDPSVRRNPTLSELLGVRDREVVWGRLVMFFAASLAANLVYLIVELIRPGSLPPEFRLYFYLTNLLGPIFRAIVAFVGFRFVKKDILSAAVAGLVYLPLIVLLRVALSPNFGLDYRIVYSWMWVFLELAFLAMAVRMFRSTWLGLAAGSVAASLLAGWIQSGIEVAAHGGRVSLGSLFGNAWTDILQGVVFASVFWFGLRLAMCRPETLGLGTAPAAPASGSLGSAGGAEDSGLRRVFDFRALAKHLRSAGIGSLIFGIIAIALGSATRGASSVNSVLVVLGVLLIAEGIWVLTAPSPAGLIIDGIVLILLGIWNLAVSGINAGRGGSGTPGFGAIGILQIGWGIQSIAQYRRFSHLGGPKPTAEEMKSVDDRVQEMVKAIVPGAPDLIEFRPAAAGRNATAWTAKLGPGSLLLVWGGKAVGLSPKDLTALDQLGSPGSDGTRKGRLVLSDRKLKVKIGEDAIARFNAWKTGA